MNYIAFDGRITRDIEISTSKDGKEFCKFTVAVAKRNKKEEPNADFIDCVAFGQSAAFLNKYFKKGDGIVIEGSLTSDKYKDKEGRSVTKWSVLVDKIGFPVSGRKTDSNGNVSVTVNEDEIPF